MTTTTKTGSRSDHSMAMVVGHYLEMVVAMFAGMVVLGWLRDLVGLTAPFDTSPGASYLLMATDMAIGMGAWMLVRRHSWAHTTEMCVAMYVPAVLLPLLWLGAIGAMTFMVAAHVLMMVLMLVVLLRQHAFRHGGRSN